MSFEWFLQYKIFDEKGDEQTFRAPLSLGEDNLDANLDVAFKTMVSVAALAWPMVLSTATALEADQRLNPHYEVICVQKVVRGT